MRWHPRIISAGGDSRGEYSSLKKINSWCALLRSLRLRNLYSIEIESICSGLEGGAYEVSRSSTWIATTGSGTPTSTASTTTIGGTLRTVSSSETTSFPRRFQYLRGFSYPNNLSSQITFCLLLPKPQKFLYTVYPWWFCTPTLRLGKILLSHSYLKLL